MNKGVIITGFVLLTLCFSLVIYDFIIGFTYGAEATISRVIWDYSTIYPAIPFGLGYAASHFTTQMRVKRAKPFVD